MQSFPAGEVSRERGGGAWDAILALCAPQALHPIQYVTPVSCMRLEVVNAVAPRYPP